MAKVFLTGANGHVGVNTARELLKQRHEVVAFVRKGAEILNPAVDGTRHIFAALKRKASNA